MLRIVEVVTQCIQAAKKALLIESNTEHKKNAHVIHDGVSWAALYWDEKERITHAKPRSSIICNAFGQREASLNSNHVCLALKTSISRTQPACVPSCLPCPGFPASHIQHFFPCSELNHSCISSITMGSVPSPGQASGKTPNPALLEPSAEKDLF